MTDTHRLFWLRVAVVLILILVAWLTKPPPLSEHEAQTQTLREISHRINDGNLLTAHDAETLEHLIDNAESIANQRWATIALLETVALGKHEDDPAITEIAGRVQQRLLNSNHVASTKARLMTERYGTIGNREGDG